MKFQLAASVLAFCGLASATTMHVVTVGKGGELKFCPEQITAEPGDLVQFQYYPKVSPYQGVEHPQLTRGRTTPSSRASSPKAARPSQKLLLAPPNKASSLVSCPSQPTQPKSPLSPSPSTAQALNGSIARKPCTVNPAWSLLSIPPRKRRSTGTRPTAPTRPRTSPLARPVRNPRHLQLFQLHLPCQQAPDRQQGQVLLFLFTQEAWRLLSRGQVRGLSSVLPDV